MAVKTAILGFFVAILAGNRPYKGCGDRYGWKLQFRFYFATHLPEVLTGFEEVFVHAGAHGVDELGSGHLVGAVEALVDEEGGHEVDGGLDPEGD